MHLDPNQSLHLLLKLVLCLFSLGSELAVPFVNGQLTASSVSFTQSGHLFAGSFLFPERVCVPARFLGARRRPFSFFFVASRGQDKRAPLHGSLESLVSFFSKSGSPRKIACGARVALIPESL